MKNKFLSALLSVAIAFGLWTYVITVVSPGSSDTFYDVSVSLVGETALEERGLIITTISSTNVDLTLSGNRSDLINVNSSNITLKADLSKIYDPGTHKIEYSISYPGNVASNAFTVESKHPESITITVEKRETKPIPVNIRYTGSLPEGFMVDKADAVLDYPEITISGPSSVVGKITQAVIVVDLDGRDESISETYRFTLCDKDGEPVDASSVTVKEAEVHLDLKVEYYKEVELKVTVVEGGGATDENTEITINPQTIRVSGNKAALEDLDSINLGTIHLAELDKAVVKTFDIILPDGITNQTGVSTAEVKILFPGLSVRTFTVKDIRAANVPEGMVADLLTQELLITVRGPSADVGKLAVGDLYVTVDFTGAEAGTTTYKATVVISPQFQTVGAVGTYKVTAAIASEEE